MKSIFSYFKNYQINSRIPSVPFYDVYLINLYVAKKAYEVHHRCVELEAQVGRADVVTDAEEALKDQSEAHALKSPVY